MKIYSYNVHPNLPEKIAALGKIAGNIWSTWTWECAQIFWRMNPELWENCNHNMYHILEQIPQEQLEELASDESFISNLNKIDSQFDKYMESSGWFQKHVTDTDNFLTAYFSMEFGLNECLPVYSGGLGVLAGDHLKTASDLGLPLVGVGLLYRQGYFQQYLNADGWQQERYPENDWYSMPVYLERDDNGQPVKISVPLGRETLTAQVWRVQVGKIPLILLDSNIPENTPKNQTITLQLYGGDRDMRIRQELLLGIGGVRALTALGYAPTVYHMNEGHSAFMSIERMCQLRKRRGLSIQEAMEMVWASTVFTTHTPVPAGNERFDPKLVKQYMTPCLDELGLPWEELLALGREDQQDKDEQFCMTVLALKLSALANGVSRLHGEVSRKMWRNIWPGIETDEVPITHVTNGVHPKSWISHQLQDLFQQYLGPAVMEEPADPKNWEGVHRIPDGEIWRCHHSSRERLVFFARRKLRQQLTQRNASLSAVRAADEVLDSHALTIGFARRFATYKRATLLFKNPERLAAILCNPDRPVQIIFAGKAHPHDVPGKEMIRKIIHMEREKELRNHIVFLEDYDINIARYLVRGVDVWLNTPRRPLEASGTSGIKASMNGGLNLSILDGWWDEGFNSDVGWAIGSGEVYEDLETQDRVESELLYDTLEQDVVELFYNRDRSDLPREWIKRMKSAMMQLGPQFSTHRMLTEYIQNLYLPIHRLGQSMQKDDYAECKVFAGWRQRLEGNWKDIAVRHVENKNGRSCKVGDKLAIIADVHLGAIGPDDVIVEVYTGNLDSQGRITDGRAFPMQCEGETNGLHRFVANISCTTSGRQGFAVRVLPCHPDLINPYLPKLATWES